MKKYLFLIFCLISTSTFSQTNVIIPKEYKYTSFVGDKYNMLLYEGKSVNLLITDTLLHDNETLSVMTNMLDSVWNFYYGMAKKYPNPGSLFNGKGYVAFVNNTCGAGCGSVGNMGVEVGDAEWVNIYNNIKYIKNGAILKVAYYEMGRNFFNNDISQKLSVDPFWMPEPFANMGYLNAIYFKNLYLKDQFENELGYKFDLASRANEYILDTIPKTISDVYQKSWYPNAYGNQGFKPFFNSGLLEKLCHDYGLTFIENFYKELYKLPNTNNNIQEAYSNFCIATSRAVNLNLKPFFSKGYKMPLNDSRVESSLADLPLLKIRFFAQDKTIFGFYTKDSTLVRVKAISGKVNSKIEYTVYEGNVGNEAKPILTSKKDYFFIRNKRFDYTLWVKATDGSDFVSSEQIKYSYRGNLIADYSFESKPNKYPTNSSSSLEFYGGKYNTLLSATRDSLYKNTGKYSLKFDHSAFTGCDNFTDRDFPTLDYSQNYIEPFKGKYRVSANILIKNQFETCPHIVYGGGIHFGARFSNSLRLSGWASGEVFRYQSLDIDTREDTTNHSKSNFFTIISYGIKGVAFVDDISVKAILIPESIRILSINSNQSKKVVAVYDQKDFISMLVDSAQDISEYVIVYSKDSTFNTNYQTIKSSKNKFAFSIKDVGTYYFRTYATNDFGQSEYSPIKEILISNNMPVAIAGKDQTINEGETVNLDGSTSYDPDKNAITFSWTPPKGIILSSFSTSNPTFKAPQVKNDTILNFSFIVNDGLINSLPSTVKVSVKNVIKTGIEDLPSKNFVTYPNPTSGILKIEGLRTNQENRISVYSVDGILIKTKISNSITEVIDLSDQVSGVYLLFINNQPFKIIKE